MGVDTEKLILDTAKVHFVKKGFGASRMQEIADEAGINKALLHYYFRSKEKLYQKIIEQTLKSAFETFTEAFDKEGSFWERAEVLVHTYIDYLSEHPETPVFIMSELSQKREAFVDEVKKQANSFPSIASFAQSAMIAMQKGEIRTVDPIQLILTVLSMSVFPFMAKPIFTTVFNVEDEDFNTLMAERKIFILDFLKNALEIKS
jgi:TetR/AcrR family transcriptional regulator